jgi:hypothetical protein
MRAKVYVEDVHLTGYSEIVKFRAVYGGDTNAEDNEHTNQQRGARGGD